MRDFLDILLLLCFCCLPPLFVAFGGLVLYLTLQARNMPRKLAEQMGEQMGLKPVGESGIRFGGRHQDHAFELGPGITRSRPGGSWSNTLKVTVEAPMRTPLGVTAWANRNASYSLESFDKAFRAEPRNLERLSAQARAAMLVFVRKHESLSLRDRPDASRPEPPTGAAVLLEHDLRNPTAVTPDRLQAVLDEMVEVARVIETTC